MEDKLVDMELKIGDTWNQDQEIHMEPKLEDTWNQNQSESWAGGPVHCTIYVIVIVVDTEVRNQKGPLPSSMLNAPHINVIAHDMSDHQHTQHGHARWTDNLSSPILTGLHNGRKFPLAMSMSMSDSQHKHNTRSCMQYPFSN